MSKYSVIAINKKTIETIDLGKDLTKEEAETFCEMWGWNYCNDQGETFWLSITEQEQEKD